MKDTSGRRIATAAGDAFRELHRVAYDRPARAEIRVEPDLLNTGGPLVRVTMDADRSWRLVTLPIGTQGHQVVRLTGTLGAEPADAFPAVGDLVELWRAPEPCTRRVTACDPEATIPDAPRWLGPGTVTTDDGVTHPLRDVCVIERAAQPDPYSADAVAALDVDTARALLALLARRATADTVAAMDINTVSLLQGLLTDRLDAEAPEGFAEEIREALGADNAADAVRVRFSTDWWGSGYFYSASTAVVVLADGTEQPHNFDRTTVEDQLTEISRAARRDGALSSTSELVVDMQTGAAEHL